MIGFLILLLIVVIYLAPALSDLQTVSRGNDIVDTAKEGDLNKATEEWGDLVEDISLGAIWNALWAPILVFLISGLTILLLFLRKRG